MMLCAGCGQEVAPGVHPSEGEHADCYRRAAIDRLTAENEKLRAARDECERQFQEKVAEVGRLTDAILFARSEGFEWPADPFGYQQQTMPTAKDILHDRDSSWMEKD